MAEYHASEIITYKICPRMYKYANVLQLAPKLRSSKLDLGVGFHVGLAAYYASGRNGQHGLDTYDAFVEMMAAERAVGGEDTDKTEKLVALGKQMLTGYFTYADIEDTFNVVHIERDFKVPIWTPNNRRSPGNYHAGTLDGVVQDRWGNTWLMEHKTCAQFPAEDSLQRNRQAGMYLLATAQIFDSVTGIIFNHVRKQNPKTARTPTVRRTYVTYNAHQLAAVRDDLYYTMRKINTDKVWLAHEGMHCGWRCAYAQLCAAEEDGSDVQELIDLNYRPREDRTSWAERITTIMHSLPRS